MIMSVIVITIAINIRAIIFIETDKMLFDMRGEPIFTVSGYFIDNVSFIFVKEKRQLISNIPFSVFVSGHWYGVSRVPCFMSVNILMEIAAVQKVAGQ